jgi:eukaryotic-like serine/threonine-protein kinase
MRKNDKIESNKGTYLILKDFVVTGGMSKVTTAKLDTDGQVYFIKEFLAPKYPVDPRMAGNAATIDARKKRCEEFEKHHQNINKQISKKSSIGGNLISAFDFFRYHTTYFKVCENIDISSISIAEIAKLPPVQRLLIIRTIVSSLKILHDLSIVHGDLKPDNILIKRIADDKYVSKLIDFDNSYFSSKPPLKPEEVVGTQEYYSPELAQYIVRADDAKADHLTIKSDVFALGILFCEYWSGKKPKMESKYHYVWQQVLDGKKVSYDSKMPSFIRDLIDQMLAPLPKDRPDLSTIISIFRSHSKEYLEGMESTFKKEDEKAAGPTPKLKGSLVNKKDKPKEPEDKSSPLKGKLLK